MFERISGPSRRTLTKAAAAPVIALLLSGCPQSPDDTRVDVVAVTCPEGTRRLETEAGSFSVRAACVVGRMDTSPLDVQTEGGVPVLDGEQFSLTITSSADRGGDPIVDIREGDSAIIEIPGNAAVSSADAVYTGQVG